MSHWCDSVAFTGAGRAGLGWAGLAGYSRPGPFSVPRQLQAVQGLFLRFGILRLVEA
jgi:hypothetical protein